MQPRLPCSSGCAGHVALKPPAAVDRHWNRLERRTPTKVMAQSDRRRSRILIESHHYAHVKWHRNTGMAAQAVLCAPALVAVLPGRGW